MAQITGSVGRKGLNRSADVRVVSDALVRLGFRWAVPDSTGACGPELVSGIELFQAIKEGLDVVKHTRVDGRVDTNGETLRWLDAANAPRWEALLGDRPGLSNYEVRQGGDKAYCTSWLNELLSAAAASYQAAVGAAKPNKAPITVNDASPARGGKAPPHKGHQTGLVCDLRLPRTDGTAGGVKTTSPLYDREAMRQQLLALRQHPLFDIAFLNDDTLIASGLCRPLAGHDDHVHIEVKVPPRA